VPCRMSARVGDGGALTVLDDAKDIPPLTVPDGAAGVAERALGRADPEAARNAVAGDAVAPLMGRGYRARASLMEGRLDEARAILGDARSDPALALADAALCLAEGDAERARVRAEAAWQQNPTGLAECYVLALARVALGDMGEAMTLLTDVSRSDQDHAVGRYQLGQLFLAMGDPARAGTLFEMAWILAPTFVAPALALAEMLVDSRQYGEALALVSGIVDAAPQALSPRLLQLRILLEVGEHQQALQLAFVLHEKAPDEPEVTLLWAEALLDADRGLEARAALEQQAQAMTVGRAAQRARRLLSRIAMADVPQRLDEAVALLRAAAAAHPPTGGELLVELFHATMAAGRRGEAEDALAQLANTEGVDVGALVSGALLARSHGMYPRARALAEAARQRVAGTMAESQLEAFIKALP
jgi:tetratricopeptide (TPR) repeat protein